ncbi:MAG: phosphoesterase [Nitrospiraceae bacterium]
MLSPDRMSHAHAQPDAVIPPDLVLYHAECTDGFGAAWALWKRFPAAHYLPVKHGQPPPHGLASRRIMILDFSYPRAILEAIAQKSASLLVLDHHITAERALVGLPFARFDQKKSGAVMAWEWAHTDPVPWLLQYVQDKDLWHWALPASREINAALASYPFDFYVWDGLRQETLEAEGRAILRYENELVDKLAAEAVPVSFHGETVPAVQSAVLTSQIGERLSRQHPFCLIWHDRDGRRYFSLRSRADGPDVASVATAYGGGGHTHAAGFSVPLGSKTASPLAPIPKLTMPRAKLKKRGTSKKKAR